MIVDTHVHVVARDEARYPLHPAGVGTTWFREHPVTVEEYAATAAAAGVERATLVQAFGAYSTCNDYVLDAAATDERFVSVVIVAPGDVTALRAHAARPRCHGVRLFAVGPGAPAWFDGDEGIALWDAAVDLDLRIVVTLLAPELPRLARLLARTPGVPVVLDHCGFPDVHDGPPFGAAADLFALADHPGLHLKLTSHVLQAAGGAAGSLVERLVATFGVERLVWGSDFPQTHHRTYAELLDLARHACAGLPGDDQARVLGGNALRLWPQLAGASTS